MPENCTECGCGLSWASDTCPKCGCYVGAPNVREVCVEREALMERYNEAMDNNRNRGCESNTKAFAEAVAKDSVAVINFWPQLLLQFLLDTNALYANYENQVRAEIRRPAQRKNDRTRSGTVGTLFGEYGKDIRCAALSLDGIG